MTPDTESKVGKLTVSLRNNAGKGAAIKLRQQGKVPGVCYGSSPEGRAVGDGQKDTTCNNWTSSDAGSAIVGHHDRQGLDTSPPALSWNSSHGTKGCSQPALVSTGGAGLIYCFATN